MGAVNTLFGAAYNDDQIAIDECLRQRPHMLLVRQCVPGQRASLAHALAAGGAVHVAPKLLVAMHGAAVRAGRAAAAEKREDKAEQADAELAAAVGWAARQRDVLGRTPLHYAARAGEIGFLKWTLRTLSLRPAAASASLFGAAGEAGEGVGAAHDAADLEVRRAVFNVALPGGTGKSKMLVVLGQASLRLWSTAELPNGGADCLVDGAALPSAKPVLALQTDKLLYRKSEDRAKRDCLEVVMVRKPKGKLKQMSAFESSSTQEDILELYPGASAEQRGWMAALHSPRYLLARGMHLVSAVSGGGSPPQQLDIWARHALINARDARGETPLHAAIVGMQPGDEQERGRLLTWMLEMGAQPLDEEVPAAAGPRKRSVSLDMSRVVSKPATAPSPLELLLQLAADMDGGLNAEADETWASLLEVLLKQASCFLPASAVVDAAKKIGGLREKWSPALLAGGVGPAPRTHAVLQGGVNLLAHALTSQILSPPPPAAAGENRSLVLLSIEKLEIKFDAGAFNVAPEHIRFAVSMVHEPTAGGGLARGGGGGGGGGGLGNRAALFEQKAQEAAAATPPGPRKKAAEMEGTPHTGGTAGFRRNRLANLVSEQQGPPPLLCSSNSLWWAATWSAPYLPGEEGAHLLIKLIDTTAAGEDALLGWVALSLDRMGEQYLQLRESPLPCSASEARAPKSPPVDLWLNCELCLGVTGSYAVFLAANPQLGQRAPALQRHAASDLGAAGTPRVRRSAFFRPTVEVKPREAAERPALAKQGTLSRLSAGVRGALKRLSATGGGSGIAITTPRDGHAHVPPPAGPAAAATKLPADMAATLSKLPEGPSTPADIEGLLAHEGATSTHLEESAEAQRLSAARRRTVLEVAEAAAGAAASGESELGLRGYAEAFRLSGSAALLLGAANMLLKLGRYDAAEATYAYLNDQAGLTANQRSLLLAKADELKARRAREASHSQPSAQPPGTPATATKVDRRASAKHVAYDAEVLQSLTAGVES